MSLEHKCQQLALKLMFGPKETINLTTLGLSYRKNKTKDDVNLALTKGFKSGMGSTEFEIDMVSCYLKNVFKENNDA